MMMAEGLAVGGNVDQLRPTALTRDGAQEPSGQVFTSIQQPFESHGLGDGTIIKEKDYGAPGG